MALGANVNERATLMEVEIKAIRLPKNSMVRVSVFDEVHNLLADSSCEQRVILQLFRHLSSELKASLVCLGVAAARDVIAGDVRLARRLDQLVLTRWRADQEFQELITAILRGLPLKRPSALSPHSLRHLARITDGITAREFGVLNELAIDAIATGVECISDSVIEAWKPTIENEAAFARPPSTIGAQNETGQPAHPNLSATFSPNQFESQFRG